MCLEGLWTPRTWASRSNLSLNARSAMDPPLPWKKTMVGRPGAGARNQARRTSPQPLGEGAPLEVFHGDEVQALCAARIIDVLYPRHCRQ